jgi:hypothetical protein
MRWRIERDYQDLKQEFGLGHYEGRGWRGFHHHATLSIAPPWVRIQCKPTAQFQSVTRESERLVSTAGANPDDC